VNISVNLTKRLNSPKGYFPVVYAGNGRLKPDVVLVNGTEERHPNGAYYIDWTIGSARKRKSVGKDPAQALTRKHRKQAELAAGVHGIELVPEAPDRRQISAAIAEYLEEVRLSKSPGTLAAYKLSLKYFEEHTLVTCKRKYVDEIQRVDMLQFTDRLRVRQKLADITVHGHFLEAMIFLKREGRSLIVKKNDWPRFTLTEPEIYTQQQLDQLFAASSEMNRLIFQFLLVTGVRRKELLYATCKQMNFTECVFEVRGNPEFRFFIKNYEERSIPVPKSLLLRLAALVAHRPKTALLFSARADRPIGGLNRRLKDVAAKAQMDRKEFHPHKFRATFATWALWNSVDLRTVQLWLGHKDLAATMRYLKPNRDLVVRAKVDTLYAGLT